MRRLLLILAFACFAAGCPITNSTSDASPDAEPDAFLAEVVPGISNDAQLCELTRGQLLRRCDAQMVAGIGSARPLRCVDGTTFPAFMSAEQCANQGWQVCEDSRSCYAPVGAGVLCTRAIIRACLEGTPELIAERDRWCNVMAPPGCTIDRSLAYREP